jgi:hypothetical protein
LIFGYSTYFFQLAGYPKPFEASLIISFILLAFIFISFFVVDKFGRRPLLLGGGLVMAICTMSIGGIGFKEILPGGALVALAAMWVAAYALSAGPLGRCIVRTTRVPKLIKPLCRLGVCRRHLVATFASQDRWHCGVRNLHVWRMSSPRASDEHLLTTFERFS